MFMTNEERELRKNLRLKLEEIADRNKLFDNHGNEIKAIYVTDVMRLILEEDIEILELQKEIQKLTTSRMEIMANSAITPDKIVMEAFAKCRGLGLSTFTYSQSVEDLSKESDVLLIDFTPSEKFESVKFESQENKANKVLKLFGYKTEKQFPTNSNDAFFFDIIFSCIEQNILDNNIDTSDGDIIKVINNIDDDYILKYFENFPVNPNFGFNVKDLKHPNAQHCRNYMITISEMILKEIKDN